MQVMLMPKMMPRRAAPTGARAHFMRESQAKAMQARRTTDFGTRMASVINRKRGMEMRERAASQRSDLAERAQGTRRAMKELGEFVGWAREKLAPRQKELEFGGVRLSSHETAALRNLVNQKRLSSSEERLVGEALEKLVRKGGSEGRTRTQAI